MYSFFAIFGKNKLHFAFFGVSIVTLSIMKQPFWKIALSYLVELPLEQSPSAYSKTLEVSLRNGRYLLSSPQAVYSYEDLYVNFRESFKLLTNELPHVQRVLVLGLGLGSVPQLLEQSFGVQASYTLVELDAAVVRLAEKYTLPRLQSPYTIYNTDAADFVASCKDKFDLIAIDLFIDDVVPTAFDTPLFLGRVQRLLAPNGLVLFNRLSYTPALATKSQTYYESVFQSIFSQHGCIWVKGNQLLINRAIAKK